MSDKYLSKKYFLNGVYGVDTFTEVTELFRADYRAVKDTSKEEAIKLFQKYVLAITFRSSPKSISTSLSMLRKVIKEEGGKYQGDTLDCFWFYELHPFNSSERAKKLRELIKGIKSPFAGYEGAEDGESQLSNYADGDFISCILSTEIKDIKVSLPKDLTVKEAWGRVIVNYEKKSPIPRKYFYRGLEFDQKKSAIIFISKS